MDEVKQQLAKLMQEAQDIVVAVDRFDLTRLSFGIADLIRALDYERKLAAALNNKPKPLGEGGIPVPQPKTEVSLRSMRKATLGEMWGGNDPYIQQQFRDRADHIEQALRQKKYHLLFKTPRIRRHAKISDEWAIIRGQYKDGVKEIKGIPGKAAKAAGRFAARSTFRAWTWSAKKLEDKVTGKPKKRLQRYLHKQVVARVYLTRRYIRKKRKDDGSLRQAVSRLISDNLGKIAGRVLDTVKATGRAVFNVTRAASRAAGIERAIANASTSKYVTTSAEFIRNTRAYQFAANRMTSMGTRLAQVGQAAPESLRVAGRGLVRVGKGVGAPVVRFATAGGQLVRQAVPLATKAAITGARIANAAVKSAPQGALAAIGAAAVFGVSPVTLAGGFVTGVALGTAERMAARSLQPLRNLDGSWKVGQPVDAAELARVRAQGNVYGAGLRTLRAANTGLAFASIAAIAGTLLGINPLAAAAGGFVAGAGGRYFVDRFFGSRIANVLGEAAPNSFLGKLAFNLARIPAMSLMNQYLGNQWFMNELYELQTKYNGDIGRYLRENFSFEGKDLMGMLEVGGNYVGAAAYLQATASTSNFFWSGSRIMSGTNGIGGFTNGIKSFFGYTGVQSGAPFLQNVGQFGRGLLVRVAGTIASPAFIGGVAGTIIGTVAGTALGLGVGLGATIGATVGGLIGTGVGMALAGAAGLTGVGLVLAPVIVTVTTAIGNIIGRFFGQMFDSTVGKVIDNLMGRVMTFISGIGALFNLLNLAIGGINVDNLVPTVLSLISLFAMFSSGNDQSGANNPTIESGNSSSIIKLELGHYNAALVGKSSQWPKENIRNILVALDDLDPRIIEQFKGKKILITTGEEAQFELDEFILISVNPESIKDQFIAKSTLELALENVKYSPNLSTNDVQTLKGL